MRTTTLKSRRWSLQLDLVSPAGSPQPCTETQNLQFSDVVSDCRSALLECHGACPAITESRVDFGSLELIFSVAAMEFFDGIDTDGLSTDHILEDHDAQRGLSERFDLEPHRGARGCFCHSCEAWAVGSLWGFPEHDWDRWCSCIKCECWKAEDRRKELLARSEREIAACTKRLAKPPIMDRIQGQ